MGCHTHRSDEWPEQLVGLEVRSALLKYKANTLCLNSISCHILRHHTLSTSYIKPGIFPLYKISSSPWMLPIRSSRGSSVFHLKQNLFWAPSSPPVSTIFRLASQKNDPHSFSIPSSFPRLPSSNLATARKQLSVGLLVPPFWGTQGTRHPPHASDLF